MRFWLRVASQEETTVSWRYPTMKAESEEQDAEEQDAFVIAICIQSQPNPISSNAGPQQNTLSSHPSVGSVVPPKLKVEATARVTCGEWLERTNPHRQRQPKVKEDS